MPTDIWSSLLGEEGRKEEEGRRKEEEDVESILIKYRGPHLAGGEKHEIRKLLSTVLVCINVNSSTV